MGSSLGFGSTTSDYGRAIHTRFRFGFVSETLNLNSRREVTRRLIMQKARSHPFHSEEWHRAPTDCKYMVSGTISLP